jgi:hypothetical protein
MKTKIDPSMRIPPRAPRLPRDHFAMRPEISLGQRIARFITIAAVVAYFLVMYFSAK